MRDGKSHSSLGTASMIDYPITSSHPSEHTDMRNTNLVRFYHTHVYIHMNMYL